MPTEVFGPRWFKAHERLSLNSFPEVADEARLPELLGHLGHPLSTGEAAMEKPCQVFRPRGLVVRAVAYQQSPERVNAFSDEHQATAEGQQLIRDLLTLVPEGSRLKTSLRGKP
jgi:hypothetical protein